jgi:putative hemolysin
VGAENLVNEIFGSIGLGLFFFAFSMFFSAAETGLVSLSRPRLKKLISQKPELAETFTAWLASPQYLLTTLLVGSTLCDVLTTVLMTHAVFVAFPHWRQGWVVTGLWLFLTVFLFVFTDLFPKSVARHYPQRVTMASLRWTSALSSFLTPFIRLGMAFFGRLFPVLQGAPVRRMAVYSLEELRDMIRAIATHGAMDRRSTQMMERVLALNRTQASQIMTPFSKIDMVNLGMDTESLLDQIAEAGRTRVPAYRANPRKIGGFLHVKDLLMAWRGLLPVKLDLLMRQPLFIAPAMPAGDLLEEFRKGTSHLAVVVNPEGDCQGIVTLEDVLEEVVGEILDEYDLENPRGIV